MGEAYRPLNLAEALEIVEKQGAVPLAGGTDLMVQHRSWSGLPPRFERPVVFIGHLDELREIKAKVVAFIDDNFFADIKRAERICELIIEEKLNMLYKGAIKR